MDHDDLARRLMATFLDELEEHVQAWNKDLLALEKAPMSERRGEIVKGLFRTAHSLKGASRAVGATLLEGVCHRLEELLAGVRDGTRALGADELEVLFAAGDAIADAGKRLRSGGDLTEGPLASLLGSLARAVAAPARDAANAEESPRPAPVAAAASVPSDGFLRVPAERLDALLAQSGELVVARTRLERRSDALGALHEWVGQWRTDARILEHAPPLPRRTAAALARTTENLRRLEKELGRLSASLAGEVRFVGHAARALDEEVRRVRILPFSEACSALERTVRDLSASTRKEVSLTLDSGEVMLDRYIIQRLKDPLLHLVRNAIDHGIEPVAKRLDAGKPARGTITVDAITHGSQVEVRVTDDGRGLDLAAIRARAAKLGIALPEGDHEAALLVFQPGFSTAPMVTEVSGRGVGLDVVNESVLALHGAVDVTFQPGLGTTFALTVPLTLTTLRALLLVSGGQTFALAGVNVQRLLRVEASDFVAVEGREMLRLGDRPVPVVSLAETLGLREHEAPHPTERALIALVAAGGREVGFLVDELLSEEEVVVKNLGARLVRVRHVVGATILASGKVALILSAADLVRSALRKAPARSLGASLRAPARAIKKRLLVVDDSVTTRTLERTILEAAGYDVTVASDGDEAWRMLQDDPRDLVVSDVEMPRMDGFALTEAIRGSRRLCEVPVVLVTALASEGDKMRGLESGANAYLVKSAFDQQGLLETIAQLL